jgi:hypothetical protein
MYQKAEEPPLLHLIEGFEKLNMEFNPKSVNEIITESGGVQEVAAPPLRPTAEE